jgi:hypothetical protein
MRCLQIGYVGSDLGAFGDETFWIEGKGQNPFFIFTRFLFAFDVGLTNENYVW